MKIQFGAILTPPAVPALHLSSPELPISDAVGNELLKAIAEVGGKEGRLDLKTAVDVPVVFNLFGLHVDRPIPVEAETFVQIISDPVPNAMVSEQAARIAELEAELAAAKSAPLEAAEADLSTIHDAAA